MLKGPPHIVVHVWMEGPFLSWCWSTVLCARAYDGVEVKAVTPPINYAHRGASAIAPENTMPAFIEAIHQGADAIECDVQFSRDGVPIVIHDEFLERTTNGFGRVSERTSAELIKLDAGYWFHPKYAGTTIPTLEELLAWLHSNDLRLNIELKASPEQHKYEKTVIDMLRKYRMRERTVLSTYDLRQLQRLRSLDKSLTLAYIYFFLNEPWKYAHDIGVNALHVFYPLLHEETIHQARAHQMDVVPYTVDEWSEISRLLRYPIAGIITNYPNRVRKFLTYS